MKKIIKKVFLLSAVVLLVGSTVPSELLRNTKIGSFILPSNIEAAAPLDTVQLAGGLNFSVLLKDDGTVWTWGRNDYGTLGLNDYIDRSSPTRIDPKYFNDEKIIQIEASSKTVLARTETDRIYYWGNNQPKPTVIYGTLPVIDMEASGKGDTNNIPANHIVTNEGYIRTSGTNVKGQFGIGTDGWRGALGDCKTNSSTSSSDFQFIVLKDLQLEPCPDNNSLKRVVDGTAVPLSNVVDISINTGNWGVLALTTDGELYTYGNNRNIATKLPSAENYEIKKIEMFSKQTFLTESGELYYYPSITSEPVKITLEGSNNPIVDVKGGDYNLLILDSAGKLYAFGANKYGNLGNVIPAEGVSIDAKVAPYTGIDHVMRIGAGVDHTILQYDDTTFATLGRNSYGELSMTDENSKTQFVKNPGISNVKEIQAINYSSYAATNDAKFYSWGGREQKETIRTGDIDSPGLVKDFSSISPIKSLSGYSEGYVNGGILLENGDYWNFGENWKRGLGTPASYYVIGELTNRNTDIPDAKIPFISGSQGDFHGTGVDANGTLYTWGYDSAQMLGIGYPVYEYEQGVQTPGWKYAYQYPIVPDGVKFVKTYSGNAENVALTESGDVYVWGSNNERRFGLNYNPTTPTKINTLPPIKEVAFGSSHNLYLDFNGDVWAAGYNGYGQLGLGNTQVPSLPTKIPTLSNIQSIGAGRSSSYAVTETGELYTWGDNRYGQLGLGDLIQRNEPRLVSSAFDVKSVTAGRKHAMYVTNSGDVFVTGSDGEGQLGLNQSQVNEEPVPVFFPPNITIDTPDNQALTVNDTLDVKGSIFTETVNTSIKVNYQIESIDGRTSYHLKDYVSGPDSEPFNITISLSGYKLGAYTLIIRAETDTGVYGEAAINFSVQDKTAPTIIANPSTIPKWSLVPVDVKITADDTGGSGYRGFRYAITNNESKPNNWSDFINEKNKTINISNNGASYLHLEAYDNIGNSKYLKAGPYYLDLTPPDFIFTEPTRWQQGRLDLGVIVQDVSNIVSTKWMQGTYSMDEVKTKGNNLIGSSISITTNGIYSFYTIDENNQETFEMYNVSNINYLASLQDSPRKIIVPSDSKDTSKITTLLSHKDDGDSLQLVTDLGNTVIHSSNLTNESSTNKNIDWSLNFSSLSNNTTYSGNLYLKDSRGGSSNMRAVNIEAFKPELNAKSDVKGIKLSWNNSNLKDSYRLLRNGEIIYSGTNNSFYDTSIEDNSSYIYTLEVMVEGMQVRVDTLTKNSGYTLFETPSIISFPEASIGNNILLSPTNIDLDYVRYEDFSDNKLPYSLVVSMTEFSSGSGSAFRPIYFKMNNVKSLDNTNNIRSSLSDIYISNTPYELVGTGTTSLDSYSKFLIEKNNILMLLPNNIKLNSKVREAFTSELIWEVRYAP